MVASLFAIVAPNEVLADYRTFGATAALQDFLLFAFAIALTVAAGLAIRVFGRRDG
jgi:hypothetical protein